MRNTFSLFGGLFVLLLSFSSCLEEQNATTFVPGPETEDALGKMVYRGVESPLVAAYDMNGSVANPTNGAMNQATIILANTNMMGADSRLTETGDVLILNIIKDGNEIAGTYRPTDWNSPDNNTQFFSNICTGINFSTGAMQDDEGMEGGEATITDHGDGTITIDFSFVTYDDRSVSGTWSGELTTATY